MERTRVWRAALVVAVALAGGRGAVAQHDHDHGHVHGQPDAESVKFSLRWKGSIEVRQSKLAVGVNLEPGSESVPARGTIDVPPQGLRAIPLTDVMVSAREMGFTFAIPGSPPGNEARFTLKISEDGQTASGDMVQSGKTFRVTLERIAEGDSASAGPIRPQEPAPPYPYARRDVSYANAADGTLISGTLSVPAGQGPFPAVVLISGSGAQDRDGSVAGHRPFLVLADYLSRRGIAVLRADDRGVGGTGGSLTEATSEVLVGDALAGVSYLRRTAEIDQEKIGLIGHSEGGVIAPMAAARSPAIAFVVTLAGPAMKGRDLMTAQSEAMLRAAGIAEEEITTISAAHRKLMDAVERGAPATEVEDATRALAVLQLRAAGQPVPGDEELGRAVQLSAAGMMSPWIRDFVANDPREALRRVDVPILAVYGGLDLQVPPDLNRPEFESALEDAGNGQASVRVFPGLNHLFQHGTTGLPNEYHAIPETIAPEVLEAVCAWVLERAKGR